MFVCMYDTCVLSIQTYEYFDLLYRTRTLGLKNAGIASVGHFRRDRIFCKKKSVRHLLFLYCKWGRSVAIFVMR